MSGIRIAGAATALLLIGFAFIKFRRGDLRRSDFSLATLGGAALLVVSLFPEAVTVLRDMLALDAAQFSRLIAVLILCTAVLWLMHLGMRVRITKLATQLDRMVRAFAIRDFETALGHTPLRPTILVVIPAFNEADSLGAVLEAIPRSVLDYPVGTLVVDDGSTDGTAEVAHDHQTAVIRLPINRGGGAALRVGFDVASRLGAEVVVTLDADGQHLPEEMEALIQPVLGDEADIVVGSRLLGRREADSVVRLFGIYFFNVILRILTPVRITDCSSGFRAVRTAVLDRLVLEQDQYHTTELIIDAARRGLRILERPITVRRRRSGESKKGGAWMYGLSFAKTILRTWWR